MSAAKPTETHEQILHASEKLREVDVQFVNPFLTAVNETLRSMGHTSAQKGAVSLINVAALHGEALIYLRVEGTIKGIVVLEMPLELAKKFVSIFLLGVPIIEMDEMAKNSLREFSLRISEIARGRLVRQGFLANVYSHLNISRPISFRDNRQFIVVPFKTSHGDFRLFFNIMKTEVIEKLTSN